MVVLAQQLDTAGKGRVKGIVKDSVDNHLLRSASVSIYKVADSSLVSYQLTDNFGEFNMRNLPLSIPLRVIVSSTGYDFLKKNFIIPNNSPDVDLASLRLVKAAIELREVVISSYRPPVQMNGDTLEFNAEAFKLDPNAVVEDLMRKLPGVTVWGDGKITVNGKKVEKVYVDGKPFFGDNGNIAIKNISNGAVDKVQVYNKHDESRSPLDSVLNVNINLKKGKKDGYFGKMSAGYGSERRYEGDGTINQFSPRTQVSLVAATNNVNKISNDVSTLLNNSSFKGVGVNIEYQPNFEKQGLNRSTSGGFEFMHYFIPDEGYDKNNHLFASYFITNQNNKINKQTQTIVGLGGDNNLISGNEDSSMMNQMSQNLRFNYTLRNKKIIFYSNPSFSKSNESYYQPSRQISQTTYQGLQSSRSSLNDLNSQKNNFSYQAGFENRLKKFKLDYTFILNENRANRDYAVSFISPIDPTQNEKYDRIYAPLVKSMTNWIGFNYEELKTFLFGNKRFFDIHMRLINTLDIKTENATDVVSDIEEASQSRLLNSYLSNKSNYKTFNEQFSIKFEKYIVRELTGRYKKKITISSELKNQIFALKNTSEKTFQNINRTYNRFLPQLHIDLSNDQYEDHKLNYDLNYNTSVDYPSIYQLAPLVDSTNFFYRYLGNPSLKPSYRNEASFSFSYIDFKLKNIIDNFKIYVMAGNKTDVFSDSTIYDGLGRAINYSVNVNPNRYYRLNGEFQKAYKSKSNQIQITGNTTFFWATQPSFLNGEINISSSKNIEYFLNLLYTLNDSFAINVKEHLSTNNTEQTFNNNKFKNSTQRTLISASYNLSKKVNLSSNVTFTKYTASYSLPSKFTIWNANISYRFMKGNQAEIKFSALDLLRQNTGIININNYNSITSGTVNVLRQYFMLNLSYFPRKFGDKNSK